MVVPTADRPPPPILERFEQEFELKNEPGLAGAGGPLELISGAGRAALVLEDRVGALNGRWTSSKALIPDFDRFSQLPGQRLQLNLVERLDLETVISVSTSITGRWSLKN